MPQLLEVWNDTVDSKHLVGSIAIGIGVAVPAFLISDHLFTTTGDPELGHSYALLIGIVGCIIGAVIAGILFKPKRVITQSEADTRNRQEVIDEVVEEYGDLGDPAISNRGCRRRSEHSGSSTLWSRTMRTGRRVHSCERGSH